LNLKLNLKYTYFHLTGAQKIQPNWFKEIKNLRNGRFKEATEETKQCWYIFVGKIMPCINKDWNDDTVKITSLMSEHTTPSDEALAISAILKKMDTWIHENNQDLVAGRQDNDEIDDMIGDTPSPKKRKKVAREIWTDDEIKNFYNRQVRIKERRKDKMTGEDWDAAYQDYLKEKLLPAKRDCNNNSALLKRALLEEGENSTISSIKSTQDEEVATKKSVGDVGYVIPINFNDDE